MHDSTRDVVENAVDHSFQESFTFFNVTCKNYCMYQKDASLNTLDYCTRWMHLIRVLY